MVKIEPEAEGGTDKGIAMMMELSGGCEQPAELQAVEARGPSTSRTQAAHAGASPHGALRAYHRTPLPSLLVINHQVIQRLAREGALEGFKFSGEAATA